jgi:hypothetical protein
MPIQAYGCAFIARTESKYRKRFSETIQTIIFLIGMGGWNPMSTRHCDHQQAYCASPGWLWWWRNWWNDWQGKPKYSEKTCSSVALSTTNPTCCPEANPSRRGGKPATNRLSYGTAANYHATVSFQGSATVKQNLRNVSTKADARRLGLQWSRHTKKIKLKLNPVALFRKRNISTELPPLVGEVSANLRG